MRRRHRGISRRWEDCEGLGGMRPACDSSRARSERCLASAPWSLAVAAGCCHFLFTGPGQNLETMERECSSQNGRGHAFSRRFPNVAAAFLEFFLNVFWHGQNFEANKNNRADGQLRFQGGFRMWLRRFPHLVFLLQSILLFGTGAVLKPKNIMCDNDTNVFKAFSESGCGVFRTCFFFFFYRGFFLL